MTPCYAVEIVTPKKFVLRGLWFGPKRPKRCIVWVHGLGSSMFSKLKIVDALVDVKTAVLVFNNRGHDKVASVFTTKGKRIKAGSAHEKFIDCLDDISGAIHFAKKSGAKSMYLAGHSTGSQKSAYWAAKRGRGVKGIVLLGPMSDSSTGSMFYTKKQLQRALVVARKYVRTGKKHILLPEGFDAQRFLSLYSGEGPEEIFPYWDEKKNPRTLKEIRLPTLVVLAEKDEFGTRPAKELARWFERHLKKGKTVIIPRVPHSFHGGEKKVAREIRRFMAR